VREKLSMLVEMQDLDDKLRDLRESKTGLEKLEAQNASELEILDGMLSQQSERIEETRSFVAEKQGDIEDKRQDLSRSRSRLSGITSQRELTAVNKELEAARKGIQSSTEELAKLEAELEGAEADFATKTGQRKAIEVAMGGAVKSQQAGITELESHAGEFHGRRSQIRELLERPLVGRYDRVSKGRGGQAVSDVGTVGRCAGCNMQVPPQVFIRLQRMATLEACAHCQRMLVYRAGLGGDAPTLRTGDEIEEEHKES